MNWLKRSMGFCPVAAAAAAAKAAKASEEICSTNAESTEEGFSSFFTVTRECNGKLSILELLAIVCRENPLETFWTVCTSRAFFSGSIWKGTLFNKRFLYKYQSNKRNT